MTKHHDWRPLSFFLATLGQFPFSDFVQFTTLLVRARTLSLGRMPWLRALRDIADNPATRWQRKPDPGVQPPPDEPTSPDGSAAGTGKRHRTVLRCDLVNE